jgi:hypothetical protein
VRYVLLMYADPERTRAMTDDELAEVLAKHAALRAELVPAGELVGGEGLALPEETVALRWKGPVSTGPLVPAPQHVTAYYVVECASAGRAQEIAARLLDFHVTAVEVRRVHDSLEP